MCLFLLVVSCQQQTLTQNRKVPQKNALYLNDRIQAHEELNRDNKSQQQTEQSTSTPKKNPDGFFQNVFVEPQANQQKTGVDYSQVQISETKLNNKGEPEIASHVVYQSENYNPLNEQKPEQDSLKISTKDKDLKVVAVEQKNNQAQTKVATSNNPPQLIPTSPIKREVSPSSYVQVGAFASRSNANNLAKSLEKFGGVEVFPSNNSKGLLYLVRLGPFSARSEAVNMQKSMRDKGFKQAFITN